jgi:hypothetical protein
MNGVDLFVHALRMVLNNPGTAVRVSAALMLLQLALVLVLGTGFLLTGEDMGTHMMRGEYPVLGAIVTGIALIVIPLWIAVAWHRFILREEMPTGPLPPFNAGAIGAYFIAGVIFVLILMVVAVPLGILGGLVAGPMLMTGGGGRMPLLAAVLLFAIVYLPVAYVGYRISPILPSAALQARMPLKEAWYATGTSGAAFVVLTVVSVLAAWLLNLPAQYLPGILGVIWAFLSNWITILVGASILTTIYGHYVEGRALNV